MKKTFFTLACIINLGSLSAQTSQRIVLLEQFTNSGCSTCGTYTPQVMQFVEDNPSQVVTIAYHPEFPYVDSMYYENPVDADAKTNFYAIQFTPTAILDGNQFQGSSGTLLQTIATKVADRAAVAPGYSITQNEITLSGNTLAINLKFTSLVNNVGQNLKAMVAVVEQTVLKSAYLASPGSNSETEYNYVMRKLLPDASGTTLANLALNGQDEVPLTWTLSKIKAVSEVRIVAFVQNIDTKEVLQAAIFTPTSVTGIESDKTVNEPFIYPNPTNGILFLENTSTTEIEVKDLAGRRLNISRTPNSLDFSTLENGIYFLVGKDWSKKIIKN